MQIALRLRYVALLAAGILLPGSVARSQTVDGNVYDAMVGPGDKIYVSAAYTPPGGVQTMANLRLNTNGSIDSSFTPDTSYPAYAFGFLNDGSILVNNVAGIEKLSSTGAIDYSFPLDGSFAGQRTLVIDSSGNSFYTGSAIYSSNGALLFNYAHPFEALSMAIQSDGKILLGGTDGHLVRLNADGSLDSTFNAPAGVAGGNVQGIGIQSDGRIIVAGALFASEPNVFRLNADGTIDSTFHATTGTYGPVLVLADGTSLISSGNNGTNISFDSFGRVVTANSLIRLDSDGSLYNVQPTLDPSFDQSTGVAVYLSISGIPEPSVFASLAGIITLAAAIVIRRKW